MESVGDDAPAAREREALAEPDGAHAGQGAAGVARGEEGGSDGGAC